MSEEYVDPAPVVALSALLDSGAAPIGSGDPLPPLWHWAALARWPASSALGVDGHPRRGSFLPPVDLPRRMFAGGELRVHQPITVGSTVRREARVVSVTPKTGRTGRLVVVVVQIRLYSGDGTLAVTERQELIYREAAESHSGRSARPETTEPVGAPLRRQREWEWELRTDPTVLMRFSAATANPHRIHYDWPYATEIEGYPGLVVHGPLMTLALAETIRVERPQQPVERMRHRNLAPLFCQTPARIRRRRDPDADLSLTLLSGDANRTTEHTVLTADFTVPGERTHAPRSHL
ncbi:FAS1-like dehydratase domain-containing protein [Nocardia cyriacigeorgica]|uniref:FAS1-like dehydratase domain-containing protein n=1 Tax=Nocardia cyriacigeorgica TaxID=135487 RepID=UPI002017EE6E|nr:MaoC family dehydratase N-terminal domain-containing protein [Nocardia cyriacigeorgica]